MKKVFYLCVVTLLLTANTYAQKQGQELIDSLVKELSNLKQDTNKVNVLCNISFRYYVSDPAKGLSYGNQALDLAEQLQWEKGISTSHKVIGANYYAKSEYPKALEHFLQTLKYAEKVGNKKTMADMYGNIGAIYNSMNDTVKPLEYYTKALNIYTEMGKKTGIASTTLNIGNVYYDRENYTKSLEYHLKAVKIYEEIKGYDLVTAYACAGNSYSKLRDYDNALIYLFKSLALAKKDEDNDAIATAYKAISTCYRLSSSDGNKTTTVNKSAALSLAKKYLDSALTIYKAIDNKAFAREAYFNMGMIDSMIGNYEGAWNNLRQYSRLYEQLFNEDKDKQLTQISMQYEFDKKTAATKAEQEKKDIRQRNVRNSIAAGLLGAVIFSTVVFRQRNKISKEKKRSDELLLNILPAETAEELKQTGTTKAKQFEQVTVLFTDFKNFTAMSEQLSAQELVDEINYCYSAFDRIISKHGIEKIKTIGDSYMCAGGLPVANKTNAEEIVQAALEIRNFVAEEKQKRTTSGKPSFDIRIGCHTGPVVAGIVGIKKFAYDIWGDTVNTASRMESSGEPGKVNISNSTYELVKDKFNCTHRGKIEAKNKGMIDMYFAENK